MATISKRNGRWQAKIRKKGQRVLTKSFLSCEAAEKWARKTESEMERGIYIEDAEEARTTTLREAATSFAEEHLGRLRHGAREKNRLEALLERSGWSSLALSSLRGKDVAAYARKREGEGSKPDTIRLDLALLSRLYRHARQEWGMESLRNPVDAVRRPSLAGTARTRRLEEGEEAKLLAAAHADFRPVILWALETGMRREEIATLTWDVIDREKRTAHLPRTKNGEARTAPLSSAALEVLKSLPRRLDGGPVFGLKKDQITDRMRTTVKRAGLADLCFHDLRHEATSRFFERGTLDMMEIATITGHKTLSMLRRYTHLRAEDLAAKLG
ncbi:MAG: site-specific integrase [Trichloromonadaceae bacterium]